MADASRSEVPVRATWGRLNFEQRVAGVGALLLIVSTFGPFSFVEAAMVLTGAAILVLLRKRSQGREFHIPFGDGTVIAAAGAWSALLIVFRLPERPLGQSLLALVCAGVLLLAGTAERRKRPPDDLPGPDARAHQRGPDAVEWEEPTERLPRRARSRVGPSDAPTEVRPERPSQQLELEPAPPVNEPLPPPEFHLPGEDEEPPSRPSDG